MGEIETCGNRCLRNLTATDWTGGVKLLDVRFCCKASHHHPACSAHGAAPIGRNCRNPPPARGDDGHSTGCEVLEARRGSSGVIATWPRTNDEICESVSSPRDVAGLASAESDVTGPTINDGVEFRLAATSRRTWAAVVGNELPSTGLEAKFGASCVSL